MSLLVVMGSGETAPTMMKLHREVLARTPGEGGAVMLDTPFGFQMNADDLVARTQAYFADSVGTPVDVAPWRRADEPVVEREKALALVEEARWVFAGPGSPTYALRQWIGTPLPDALVAVAGRGGTLVFGSAAACTLGTHTIPVYEIYKVGEEPRWATGLDLLGSLTDIHAVVVPHYDNSEGGGHDTRFCYLGEQRLVALEADLPDEVGVLGVDEHTALVIDLQAGTAIVRGNGVVTVRRRGHSRTFADGEQVGLDSLRAMLRGDDDVCADAADSVPATDVPATQPHQVATHETPGLAGVRVACRARFDAALAAGDVDGCVSAILDLEAAIADWSADTLQSDDTDTSRRAVRAMVVRLGDLARVGARDPREAVGPFVELALQLRASARAAKDFATSDLVRDRLTAAGVEVRDTPDGATWVLS